jgi:hypothetical protein
MHVVSDTLPLRRAPQAQQQLATGASGYATQGSSAAPGRARWTRDGAAAKQRTRSGPFACVATHLFCKATLRLTGDASMRTVVTRKDGKLRSARTCTAHIAAQRWGSALAADCSVSRSVTFLCEARARCGTAVNSQPSWSETAQARDSVIHSSAAVCKATTSQHSTTPRKRRAPGGTQARQAEQNLSSRCALRDAQTTRRAPPRGHATRAERVAVVPRVAHAATTGNLGIYSTSIPRLFHTSTHSAKLAVTPRCMEAAHCSAPQPLHASNAPGRQARAWEQ